MVQDEDKMNCLFINRHAPHGSLQAWESLELSMISAAYEQNVCLLYIDDGVYQLKAQQDTAASGTRNYSAVFGALDDYGIQRIYVDNDSLQARGLSVSDLFVSVELVDTEALRELLEQQDIVVNN